MAVSPSVNQFFGAVVSWGTTTALNALEIIDINWSPGDRAYIDTTHYETAAVQANEIGNATKIAGEIVDPGSMQFTMHFNPSVDEIGGGQAAETITITWEATGTTWVFSGAWHPTSGTMPMNDKGTIDLHVEILGAIAVTAGV